MEEHSIINAIFKCGEWGRNILKGL